MPAVIIASSAAAIAASNASIAASNAALAASHAGTSASSTLDQDSSLDHAMAFGVGIIFACIVIGFAALTYKMVRDIFFD